MEKKVLKERVEKLCQMAADKGNSLDMTEVLDQLGDLKVTPEELERKLTLLNDALEKTMRTEDVSCIREVLHRVVPTFHEPEEVNAAQGEEVKAPVPAVS